MEHDEYRGMKQEIRANKSILQVILLVYMLVKDQAMPLL